MTETYKIQVGGVTLDTAIVEEYDTLSDVAAFVDYKAGKIYLAQLIEPDLWELGDEYINSSYRGAAMLLTHSRNLAASIIVDKQDFPWDVTTPECLTETILQNYPPGSVIPIDYSIHFNTYRYPTGQNRLQCRWDPATNAGVWIPRLSDVRLAQEYKEVLPYLDIEEKYNRYIGRFTVEGEEVYTSEPGFMHDVLRQCSSELCRLLGEYGKLDVKFKTEVEMYRELMLHLCKYDCDLLSYHNQYTEVAISSFTLIGEKLTECESFTAYPHRPWGEQSKEAAVYGLADYLSARLKEPREALANYIRHQTMGVMCCY